MEEFKLTFSNFIVSLAQTAYVQLGIVEDPFSKEKNKDLAQAKGTIDLLDMLKDKTKNNLTNEEEQLLDDILYDLRTKYLYEMDKK
jgi:hypothetical protein